MKSRSAAGIRIIVACLSSALCCGVHAQQNSEAPGTASGSAVEPPPTLPATNVTDETTLDRVVVTAQHRDENAQNVPITIDTFSAKQIKDLGITSSGDVGEFTPNVDIALPNGAGNQPIITIRGIGNNDFNTNSAGPNGVYVDEVYLSAPGAQTFQVFDLDRIEVLKGPQGTLYGRNTSGGAINYIVAKPTSELDGYVSSTIGSYGTVQEEGAIGGPLSDTLSGRLSFVKNDSSGYMHNSLLNAYDNGANAYAMRGLLLFKPTGDLSILLNIHGGQVDTLPSEYRHIGTLNPSTGAVCSVGQSFAGDCVDAFGYGTPRGFYEGAFNRDERLTVNDIGTNLRADLKSGSITYTSITSFEQNHKLHPEDTDASPNRLLEIDYGVRSNTITQEFRAAGMTGSFNWVVGLYGLHEHLDQNQPLTAFLDFDNIYGAGSGNGIAQIDNDLNHQVTTSGALFGQTDYALTEQVKLTLGGRFTKERTSFDTAASQQLQSDGEGTFTAVTPLWAFNESTESSAFSGKAALSYAPTSDINAYFSAASGFKSGAFNGGFLSASPAEAERQIGPVAPEKVLAYEAGVKSQFFDHRLQINAAVFYNDYTDMQVYNLVPPVISGGFDLLVLTNAPRAHTEGLDLQILGKPFANLTATANFGLLKTRIDQWNASGGSAAPEDYTGNRLALAPSASMVGILDYRVPVSFGSFNLVADADYRSKQFFDVSNDPFITQRAYWLANFRIAFHTPNEAWELAAFVKNAFDTKYLVGAINLTNPFGLVQDVVGTPRFVGFNARYNFF